MFKVIKRLHKNTGGATAIEYGLIAALISVAAIIAMQALGTSLNNIFNTISGEIDSSAPAGP